MMRKKKGIFITLGVVAVVALAIGGTIAYKYYQSFFAPSVTADAEYLYVYTHWEFEDVMTSIGELHAVEDPAPFRWAAITMDYPGRVKPGKYRLVAVRKKRQRINKLEK